MTAEDHNSITWVRTAPASDGSYVLTVELDPDTTILLPPERAGRYAATLFQAITYAEYDAAVFRQMVDVVGGMREAAQVVTDLRKRRPPLDPRPSEPLRFVPGIKHTTQEPFLILERDGKQFGQWDIGPAKDHALHVMQGIYAAGLDNAYLSVLTDLVQVEEHTARNVIDDLSRFFG